MIEMLRSLFTEAFLEKIIIGVVGAIVIKSGLAAVSYVRDLVFAYKNFSIGGGWAAEFESYVNKRNNIEIVLIAQHQHQIKFNLQQYNDASNAMKKYRGQGIIRGSSVSALYYAAEKSNLQHGAFALTIRPTDQQTEMVGRYAELEVGSSQNQIISSKEIYVLKPLKLNFVQRMKIRFGKRCFENYEEAKAALHPPAGPPTPKHSLPMA